MPPPAEAVSPGFSAGFPAASFEAARRAAATAAEAAAREANRLGLVRLLSFFGGIALVALAGVEVHPLAGIGVAALGLAGFNKLVGKQQRLDADKARLERIVAINDGELASLEYDFTGFPTGVGFRDPQHPYTGDLDVFGPDSIFQLLDRTATTPGTHALAHYLRQPLTDTPDLLLRQAAVAELDAHQSWRQAFLAEGAAAPTDTKALDALRAWAAAPPALTESWWPVAIYGLSVFNVLWLGAFLYLPFYVALLAYLPTAYAWWRAKPAVDAIHADTEQAAGLLARYRAMFARIESQGWQSPLLQQLAGALRSERSSVAQSIGSLGADARQLAVRVNPFVLLLNLFSLWEIRYARRLEAWKRRQLGTTTAPPLPPAAAAPLPTAAPPVTPTPLDSWLTALAAFDALSSLAAAKTRWPHWITPRFSGSGTIRGEDMHHPLLPPDRSVPNGLTLPTHAHVKLLTGSNMAGKSTYLRTVGLHLVLAQIGCVVPAKSLELPQVRVFTSMRTQDDLHEGASAFYAELQRLRIVVEAAEETDQLPVIFLLDEILKGTNSDDRTDGARALIRQFLHHGGAGIIATHDLTLGEMADGSKGRIENLRLEVETDAQGDLYFDYTVKPGLARSRNASALMRRLGLGMP